MLIASAIISGLGLGSMYGLLALGFHVTHAVSRTVNFAQGSTMMLGAVLCFTFWVTLGWPLALSVLFALAACALWGGVVERVAVRPFVARGSNSWLIATVAPPGPNPVEVLTMNAPAWAARFAAVPVSSGQRAPVRRA